MRRLTLTVAALLRLAVPAAAGSVLARNQDELADKQPHRATIIGVLDLDDAFLREILPGQRFGHFLQQRVVGGRHGRADIRRLHRSQINVHLLKASAKRSHALRIARPLTIIAVLAALAGLATP